MPYSLIDPTPLSGSVPHLAIPLVLGPGGAFLTVQQDSLDDVRQSVEVLLGTQIGERIVTPSYGIPDLTYGQIDPTEIAGLISQWEPRASATVTVTPQPDGSNAVTVNVSLANGSS